MVTLVLIILIGAGWLSLHYKRTQTIYSSGAGNGVAQAVAILARDADQDGLKDWEEELWKTDSDKADTDGDGTPDGEEIRLGRDPLKAGPNDLLDRATLENKTTLLQASTTDTDLVAQQFFASYLARKQSGQPFTADDERALFTDFFANPPPLSAIAVYQPADLTLISEPTDADYRAYGNALASAFLAHASDGPNELEIFDDATLHEDEKTLAKLEGRALVYEGLLADLKALKVPEPAAAIHGDILTALGSIASSIHGMRLVLSDPVKALASLGYYPHGIGLLSDSLGRLRTLFVTRHITFGPEEPGGSFTTTR